MRSRVPRVRGSFQQLEQVAVNLLTNACDALPSRDRAIRVSTRFDPAAARVLLEVADEGTGIAEEHRARIFDPFFTTKQDRGGTGLGLSISYGIVRDHGGELVLDSAPGRRHGRDRAPALRRAASRGPGDRRRRNSDEGTTMGVTLHPQAPVLVVDDEEQTLAATDLVLRSEGITNVVTCRDSRLVAGKLAAGSWTAVLLDLSMPHLTGLELLPRIVQEHPEVPVIVVTANAELDTAVQCMRDGRVRLPPEARRGRAPRERRPPRGGDAPGPARERASRPRTAGRRARASRGVLGHRDRQPVHARRIPLRGGHFRHAPARARDGRDRGRQGADRAGDPRAQRADRRLRRRQRRGARRHAVQRRPLRPQAGRLHRAPTATGPASSSRPRAAPCSSTKSATWRPPRR